MLREGPGKLLSGPDAGLAPICRSSDPLENHHKRLILLVSAVGIEPTTP